MLIDGDCIDREADLKLLLKAYKKAVKIEGELQELINLIEKIKDDMKW